MVFGRDIFSTHDLSAAGYESLPVSNVRTGISVYKPDSSGEDSFSWIPHSTIGKQLSQTELKEAFVVMQEQFGMFRGTAVGIGLAKTNPYMDICRVWYDPMTGKCIQNDKKAMQESKQWK